MSLQYWGRNFAGQSAQYAATPVTFSSLPPASSVEGQVRVLSDVNYIEVVSRGGVWRPRGGRQVLALRGNNPVTVQDLNGIAADTMGPFPGGLVRAGMRLLVDWSFATPGISTASRLVHIRIGNGATRNSWVTGAGAASGTDNAGRFSGVLAIVSDISANHLGGLSSNNPFGADFFSNTPQVDFSQPWSAETFGRSVAETAVTITGASWAAGVATYTTSANHTLAVGDKDVISGITPSGYNGTFIVSAVGSPTTFSVPMAVDPGVYTSGGSSSRTSNVRSDSFCLALEG